MRTCCVRLCRAPLPEGRKSKSCQKCSYAATKRSEERFLDAHGEEAARARRHGHNQKNYNANSGARRSYARKVRADLRNEFIIAYGGVCACCGEPEDAFLTLEHLDRDGKAHRDDLGSRTEGLLRDLKTRGWPKDKYALMCFNCNRARWVLGECPHKRQDV